MISKKHVNALPIYVKFTKNILFMKQPFFKKNGIINLISKVRLPYFKRYWKNQDLDRYCSKKNFLHGCETMKKIFNNHSLNFKFNDYEVLVLWLRLANWGFRRFTESLHNMYIRKYMHSLQEKLPPLISTQTNLLTKISKRLNKTRIDSATLQSLTTMNSEEALSALLS